VVTVIAYLNNNNSLAISLAIVLVGSPIRSKLSKHELVSVSLGLWSSVYEIDLVYMRFLIGQADLYICWSSA